nr:PREDICTED: phosphatidylethanolamine N-methyltransferase isoform X5 [Bos indicus]
MIGHTVAAHKCPGLAGAGWRGSKGERRGLESDGLPGSQADLCIMTRLLGYVDLSEPHFVAAVLAIVFNPLFWNVLHAGHAEPAPDAEPGQPRGLPRGPGTPGSGWRVRPFQFPGAGLHRDLPRRLLRDPQGGQSDHVPVQRPGQPHVLGQHSHLPGLGHCGRQTLTQQGCSQPFPAHLSPTWGPTDRASRWPKQPDVWKPQKVQGAGIPRASARQPERRPSPRHASPTGLLLTALVALIYMVAIVYEEPFTAEIYQQKASQAYKRS